MRISQTECYGNQVSDYLTNQRVEGEMTSLSD
jgi:hypothetical protein